MKQKNLLYPGKILNNAIMFYKQFLIKANYRVKQNGLIKLKDLIDKKNSQIEHLFVTFACHNNNSC
jgi:hypothetical protein